MATAEPGFREDSEANGRSVPVDWRKKGCLFFLYLGRMGGMEGMM
jgi:hypothetical protein